MDFTAKKQLQGKLSIPGDKSISHRSIMFGSIAEGITEVSGFLKSADCLSTISCFRKMGISIEESEDKIIIHGKGLHGLTMPASTLDAGNSGTTIRLMSGILSAQPFVSHFTGDASIQKRPMKRVMQPLSDMGANIVSDLHNDCAPLTIFPAHIHGANLYVKTASAQVKSAILLAGLYADSDTHITQPQSCRNHTEIMLSAFGANITTNHCTVSIQPATHLYGQKIEVPGDISSAAYFIAAALITPNSEVLIKNVGINPTRDGIIHVAKEMGGDIHLLNQRTVCGEPVADIFVRSSSLHGVTICGDIIPTLIDELPIIAVMCSQAKGTSVIKDAAELKVKECNRILAVSENLNAMGAKVTPTDDGFIIEGSTDLKGATIHTYSDHRIAMSFSIAALIASGTTRIPDFDCVAISYPQFYHDLSSLYMGTN